MEKFLVNTTLFFLILLGVFTLVSTVILSEKDFENHYMSALSDKHTRLKEVSSPKLIFSGGSNLAFGINSQAIQDSLSIPVVNLGLHIDLGLDFILEDAAQSANSGDIVILSIEYFSEREGNYELKKLTTYMDDTSSQLFETNYREEIKIIVDNTREKIEKMLKPKKTTSTDAWVYKRAAFNKFGDNIRHLNLDSKNLESNISFKYSYWEGIDAINTFYDKMKRKDVEVYFIHPPFPAQEYANNKEVLNKYFQDINNDLKVPILSNHQDFIFDYKKFYDTEYHLNKEGRKKRTQLIVKQLKEVL